MCFCYTRNIVSRFICIRRFYKDSSRAEFNAQFASFAQVGFYYRHMNERAIALSDIRILNIFRLLRIVFFLNGAVGCRGIYHNVSQVVG